MEINTKVVFTIVAVIAGIAVLIGCYLAYESYFGQKENQKWAANVKEDVRSVNQKIGKKPLTAQQGAKAADNNSGAVLYAMVKTGKGFMFPEITGFENDDVKAAVNAELKEKTLRYCDCNPENCDVKADVSYSRDYIFSVSIFANWYCDGSAHDVRWQDNVTFDMRSGKAVELADIFGGVDMAADGAINDEMVSLMEKHASNIKLPDGVECTGLYTRESLKKYANKYYISDAGVIFSVEFPYVASACDNDIVIPIDEIKPLAKPNTILDRLIVAAGNTN